MSVYLDRTSPDAFVGMTKKAQPHLRADGLGRSFGENTVECPSCKGYGGGHLKLNAYGPGKHFDWSCSNCTGWGWVRAGSPDALCAHDYLTDRNVGNCLNVWKCRKCAHEITVDSSD